MKIQYYLFNIKKKKKILNGKSNLYINNEIYSKNNKKTEEFQQK